MIQLPNPDSIRRVADWIELNVSLSGAQFSKTQVSSAIEKLTGAEPRESFISDIWRELHYRHRQYREPIFEVAERTIQRRPDVEPSVEYLTCLILSLFGVRGTTQDPGKLFERITSRAVKGYLSGNAVVFGWPAPPDPQQDADDESQIKRKIRKVAEDLGERFAEAPPARFNDRGVDVIGWIPFVEGRSSQVVLLLQCYAGQDWKGKLQVPLASWYQYIHWSFNPIAGFAVPRVISEQDWHEGSTDKGLLFDRARIVNLLTVDTYDPALANELRTWVEGQVAELEA
jgi:hypothetical protein